MEALLYCSRVLLEILQALLDILLCCIAEDSLLEFWQALLDALLFYISGDSLQDL